MGVVMALLLVRTNVMARQLAWIVLSSQLAVPLYVFAGGWSAGFGTQGWLTSFGLDWASYLGGTTGLSAMLAVSMIHAFASIPWVVLITSLGLLWTHRGQEEQALLDGGWSYVLFRVLLPKLRIWIVLAVIWTIMPIMTEMVVSNLYQVPTVSEQIYLDASRGTLSPLTYVAAVVLCLVPVALCLGLILRKLTSWSHVIQSVAHFRGTPLALGKWRLGLSVLCWSVVLLLVGLPIVSLIAKAGWQPFTKADGTIGYGWSGARFVTTIDESTRLFQAEYYWSSLLALGASLFALAVSIAAYAIPSRIWRVGFGMLMILAIAVPGPLVGMLVIWAMNRSTPAFLGELYDSTLVAPLLAQQFRLLPIAWVLVITTVASISPSTWEQARLDGLSAFQKLRSVLLPQAGPRLLAAWILLLVLSFGELSSTILVLPPGVTTVSMRLFEMLHFGMRHQDSGLCGSLMCMGWIVSLVFWKTLRDR